ncbi:MAG: hypothetical protein RL137_109, partial [Bacteroidota bacterium]
PMKQFVKCECCGTSMTGYLVKRKGLYYYKCNLKGCANNRSQKVLHLKFEELLSRFTFDKALKPVFNKMLLHLLSERTEVRSEDKKALQVELAQLKQKLEGAEERFFNGDIDQVLYFKYRDKYREKIRQIESELDSSQNQLSNLQKSAEICLDLALKLPSTWKNANFNRKQRIQKLVFPEGIFYDRKKDGYRTSRVNLLFSAIPYLTGLVEAYKNGDSDILAKIPTWVVPHGLEPWTHRL